MSICVFTFPFQYSAVGSYGERMLIFEKFDTELRKETEKKIVLTGETPSISQSDRVF